MKKRTDGRYCKQVVVGYRTNGTRIIKSIYGKTIREVEKRERELRNNCELGINVLEENITVEEWAKRWLTVYKQNVSHGTYLMYERSIRNHIIPTIGRVPLNKLKPINIQQAINERIERGQTRTAEIYKLTIKQIIEKAVDEGLLIKNICNSLEKIKSTTEEKRPLTKFEIECISKTAYSDKQRLFLDVLYYLGLRRGEALAISVKDDIDFKNKTLTVNHSLDISENTPVHKEPKSKAGYRTLPIPDMLFDELVRYINKYPSIFLFTKNDGSLMTRSSFRRFWDGIVRKTEECAEKIREEQCSKKLTEYINTNIGFTPHTFRHTYATNLYYAGIDIKTCQYLLGHSTLEMTLKIYTHLQNANNATVAEKINDLFGRSKVS